MFFPISDDDRHLLKPAWVTIALVVANALVFWIQQGDPDFTLGWSVVPAEITGGVDLRDPVRVISGGEVIELPQAPGPWPIYLTLLSSMFMHGGWGHIGGNMLYLWIFGDNVEHRFGPLRFLVFYVLSGLAASAVQIGMNPDGLIPNLGASGAISGVMGAYMVMFPRNRVNAIFLVRMVSVPAVVVLGAWIVMQLVSGAGTIGGPQHAGGVAYGAHIGGFVAGVVAGVVARLGMKKEPPTVFRDIYERQPRVRKYW
ncbi:MAG: rhomboid family intramembrane serine protease [Verrucomicrobiales bacterium]|nr:rhomboid family intramembrane serine protease [Verrucomicrobiota bacterium JB025]